MGERMQRSQTKEEKKKQIRAMDLTNGLLNWLVDYLVWAEFVWLMCSQTVYQSCFISLHTFWTHIMIHA